MSFKENTSLPSINSFCQKFEQSHQYIQLEATETGEGRKSFIEVKSNKDMNFLRQSITSILPSLSEETLQNVVTKLIEDIGVETREDLVHVREVDFQGVLKPLPARKLIHSWKENSYTCMTQCSTLDPLNTSVESYRLVPVTEGTDLTQINVNQPTVATFNTIPQKRPAENTISVPYIVTVGNTEVGILDTRVAQPQTSESAPQAAVTTFNAKPQFQDKNWINNYTLPWDKVKPKIMGNLTKNMPINLKAKRELIRTIAEDIFSITKKPSPGDLLTVAKRMLDTYPSLSTMTGTSDVMGVDCFFARLRNRLNFMRKKEAIHAKNMGYATDWLETFYIPWHKLSDKIRNALDNGVRLERHLKRELVRIVADDIIQVTLEPKAKQLRAVSQTMVNRYPESLSDREDDAPNGKCTSLYRTLEFRMHYLVKKKRKSHYESENPIVVYKSDNMVKDEFQETVLESHINL